MIIFNDTLGAYGGSHTLMLRMCTWLKARDIRTGIFCDNRNNEGIAQELEKLGVEIFVLNIQDPKAVKSDLIKINDDVKIINFSWNFYLDIERAKKVCGFSFDNLVYCIHAATFQKGSGFKSSFMKKYSIAKYRSIFERMGKNNALIMMDEVCLRISQDFLGLKLAEEPTILRLPMECLEMPDEKINDIIKNGYASKLLMTASRAEIPYKGYLLGLLDDYIVIKEKYPEVRLSIISAGEDMWQIEEKIQNMPERYQKDIILHGWLDYESLKIELEKCMIFIGMGTSVLDAALKYKPSIPVKFYTTENIAASLLSDDVKNICAEETCTNKALPLLEKTLSFTEVEYREACYASFHSVKDNYDIDLVMSGMIKAETRNQKCILSSQECFTHKMNNVLNSIRFRNTNHFDFKKINKD
jgi:hypothetical protein